VAGRPTLTVEPAPRSAGHIPSLSAPYDGDDVYVVPSDVAGLVPGVLDDALFDVTALVRMGTTTARARAFRSSSRTVAWPVSARARPLVWLAPIAFLASAGLAVLGFFLGPLFLTVMSVAPLLRVARLVPTAVGLMVGTSVVGGAALPWLAGVIAQHPGAWTLLPCSIGLTALLAMVWWRLARRLPPGHEQSSRTRPGRPAAAPDAAR
jgi:hypothetical protein